MSVVIVPGVAGIDSLTERMIASNTSSTAITATGGVTVFDHIIPARSVGPNGYIILDIYMTRDGPNGAVTPLLLLGGEAFYSTALSISDLSFQTRFYIYADNSETAQKLATDMSLTDTPYAKANYTKENLTVDMTVDTTLTLFVNIGSAGDSLIVEGYSLRLFNPDGF